MPENKGQLSRKCRLGILLVVMAACGEISGPTEPDYVIEESQVVTPAGTVHVQVFVPNGVFVMGAEGGPLNERPVHEVALDAFYIDRFEVTNAQYLAYTEATGASFPQYIREDTFNQPDQPVVGILWEEAKTYCQWADLELPTEAQWEKAAGGVDGRPYPWGHETPDETRGNLNFSDGPTAVGNFPEGASPYGVHDMAGNVWEWTLDEYDGGYYARSPMYNPVNLRDGELNNGSDRTLRGGGWFSASHDVRVSVRRSIYIMEETYSTREELDAALMFARIGFRCVRNTMDR